jgi:fatty acid desaturase
MRAVGARFLPDRHIAVDPQEQREEMARRLPRALQPFLTWLTALPAPGEKYRCRTPLHHIAAACAWLTAGTALSAGALAQGGASLLLLPFGMLATSSGMGVLQAVIYHHCSHGTVFATRRANRAAGRLISLLLLIKDFDAYQREHMVHHSPRRLLTPEDEFLDYLDRFIGIVPGMPCRESWRRVLLSFVSPAFHARLLTARLSSSLISHDRREGVARISFWVSILCLSYWTGTMALIISAWVIPATILLQIATTLRVLAEHRFPDGDIIATRDRRFVGRTTAGVFPGAAPPPLTPCTRAAVKWAIWWCRMLTVHLFSRVFVLVGDAPAHDYHHRHPGSRKWPSYVHARSGDRAAGCPDFPLNYIGTLGLFTAIDENLRSFADAHLWTRASAASAGSHVKNDSQEEPGDAPEGRSACGVLGELGAEEANRSGSVSVPSVTL